MGGWVSILDFEYVFFVEVRVFLTKSELGVYFEGFFGRVKVCLRVFYCF